MANHELLRKCMNIPEPENRCHICRHYNMMYKFCHLENLFGYCDFKPRHNRNQEHEE